MHGTLFTWGYSQAGGPARLALLAKRFDATVIDCRSSPRTRVAGFGTVQLKTLLGDRYLWKGETLGGRNDGPTPAGLAWIRGELAAGRNLIAMCMEHAPGDCHRHSGIGLPLAREGLEVRHIYANELFDPIELQRSMEAGADDEYECETFSDSP